MKNKDGGRGRGGGLIERGGLIIFLPLKRVGLLERGAYLRAGGGGLIEDLRCIEDLAFFSQFLGLHKRQQRNLLVGRKGPTEESRLHFRYNFFSYRIIIY